MTNSFKCTSSDPYDRHTYEVLLKNGKKILFDEWEDAQIFWYQNWQTPNYLNFIQIVDK